MDTEKVWFLESQDPSSMVVEYLSLPTPCRVPELAQHLAALKSRQASECTLYAAVPQGDVEAHELNAIHLVGVTPESGCVLVRLDHNFSRTQKGLFIQQTAPHMEVDWEVCSGQLRSLVSFHHLMTSDAFLGGTYFQRLFVCHDVFCYILILAEYHKPGGWLWMKATACSYSLPCEEHYVVFRK